MYLNYICIRIFLPLSYPYLYSKRICGYLYSKTEYEIGYNVDYLLSSFKYKEKRGRLRNYKGMSQFCLLGDISLMRVGQCAGLEFNYPQS